MEKKRDLEELIKLLWEQIDHCLTQINNPENSNRDKMMWTQNLVALISRLDKLLWKSGVSEQTKEDLAQILSKIPKKYRKMLEKWCSH